MPFLLFVLFRQPHLTPSTLAAKLLAVDRARREAVGAAQAARTKRNAKSRRIGAAKAAGEVAATEALIVGVAALKARLQKGEETVRRLDA